MHEVERRSWCELGVLAALLICQTLSASAFAAPQARPLMRFPDIRGDRIVFVYGEDIWTVPSSGGVARRLTFHEGEEVYPRISPDGTLIAFTGQYDGNTDVYVMNTDGGEIRRVTYHPGEDEVIGWHPTSGKILFRSARDSYSRFDRLFLINPDGSGLEELPLQEAAVGSFSPDGRQIAYTRVSTEDRTWKRYRGGLAPEVWLYDLGTGKDRKITPFPGGGRLPIWLGATVYFSSDNDGVLNLYALDVASAQVAEVTHEREYDVRRPSGNGSSIVYELGGELWVYDTIARASHRVPVEIRADAPEARPTRVKVDSLMTSVDVSPTGARALVVARGDVFSVPRKDGVTRNLTASSGSREKDAVFSPDGTKVAYFSDQSGEIELWLGDALGERAAERLTTHTSGYRHTLRFSPDGTRLAYTDQTERLYVIEVASRKIAELDRAEYEVMDVGLDAKPISDFAWSPDSRFITYSKMNADLVTQIWVTEVASGVKHCVSSGLFNDFGPVFSRDGEHLLFVSNRHFDPTYCDFEWEMVFKKAAGIYALTLRRDGDALLPLKNDEDRAVKTEREDVDKSAARRDEEKDGKAGASPKSVRIDFDGLYDRIEELPLPRGNYRQLAPGDGVLFFLDADDGDFNRMDLRDRPAMELHAFTFKEREAKAREDRDRDDKEGEDKEREDKLVIKGIKAYALSARASHIAYLKGDTVGILDASARDSSGQELDLSGLEIALDPIAEWRQIFDDAWRLERDFYYEPGMNGLDWKAIGEKYRTLLAFASCREDVRYLVGELIGELGTSHTYVYDGDDRRKARTVDVGMLGADWVLDPAAKLYRIQRILKVPDWSRSVKPPLQGPGVDAREGDYLLAVNGLGVDASREVYAAFQGLAGQQVVLTLNDRPRLEGARKVRVVPAEGESRLRYQDWVEHNRQVVDRASGGRLGYIHLPDTFEDSSVEFPRMFYAQTQKQGLVVDGRFNAGGLDPDIFLQRLGKAPITYWTRRYTHDQATPHVSTSAHLVCLTNRQAGSGGDELPYTFRLLGLGPIVGTRSWGGLVGVSMFMPLVDGGMLTAPDYRVYDRQGRWVVENEGVKPDVEVELDSAEMAKGHDAQLEKAIELLLAAIKADPRPWPTHPPFPAQHW
jgi:tricorn protease